MSVLSAFRASDAPALAVVVVTGGLAIIGATSVTARHEAWFVNALPIAVEVQVDDRSVPVPKGEIRPVRLDRGGYAVTVIDEKARVVDHGAIAITTGNTAVFNVAGVAPLFVETLTYGAVQGTTRTRFAGTDRVVDEPIDDVFRDAPDAIAGDGERTFRTAIKLAPGGLAASVGYLTDVGQPEDALGVLLRAEDAAPADGEALAFVPPLVSIVRGPAAGAELARRLLAAHPSSIDLERSYQTLSLRVGGGDRLRAEYAARRAHDGSAPALVLHARIEAPAAAKALLSAATFPDPKDQLSVRRALATSLFLLGENDAAAALYATFESDPEYRFYVGEHARVLVAKGQPMDALAKVAAVATEPDAIDARLAVLYAEVARAAGREGSARSLVDRLATHADRFHALSMLTLANEPVSTKDIESVAAPEWRAALLAEIDGEASPDNALADVAGHPAAIDHIAPIVLLLLGLEADRLGDTTFATRLLGGLRDVPVDPRDLVFFVREGKSTVDVDRLDPELRAALAFLRARTLAAAGDVAQATTLLQQSARLDVLSGYVSRVRKRWPPTTTSVLFRR